MKIPRLAGRLLAMHLMTQAWLARRINEHTDIRYFVRYSWCSRGVTSVLKMRDKNEKGVDRTRDQGINSAGRYRLFSFFTFLKLN
jgi:hypothetical protein